MALRLAQCQASLGCALGLDLETSAWLRVTVTEDGSSTVGAQ